MIKFNFIQDDKARNDISNVPIENDDFLKIFNEFNIPPLPYSKQVCYVIGKFKLEQNSLNDEISMHLQWVLQDNAVEDIWLCRKFDNITKVNSHLILTPLGIKDNFEYFKEKPTALSRIVKERKIEKVETKNRVGRFSGLELLQSIMDNLDLQNSWCEYKIDKNVFPQYRYIDWNISMEQLSQFTKDTMQEQIKIELEEAKQFANTKRKIAQDKINNELSVFTSNFLNEIPTIEKLKANIYFEVESKVTDFILNKTNTIGDIHIESQGDGIKRQIWFSLIKWNSLKAIEADDKSKKYIWCFDEPETHLYPSAQRDFYNTIKKTSASNVQTLISTHSTIFVDKTLIRSINKVDLKNGITFISKCNNFNDVFENLKIKNSDFLFYDKFIVVEGDTEEIMIPHFYKLVNNSTLETDNIRIINLGGKDKIKSNSLILDNILKDFNKNNSLVFYILDNDAKYTLTPSQIKKYNPIFLGKQDIEDSIGTSVWSNLLKDRLEESLRLSIDEINEIKMQICDNKEEKDSNKKFYPTLKKRIYLKLKEQNRDDFFTIEEALPTKGNDSGKVLNNYILSSRQLPRFFVDKLKEIKEL